LRATFAAVTERIRIPGLEPLEIIDEPALPMRLRAELFLSRTRDLGGQMIFLASRAQHGARRFLGGSFTETLAGLSPLPCLIMNPSWNRLTDYQSFSFATGFSKTSLAAFEILAPWLHALHARLRILHFRSLEPRSFHGSPISIAAEPFLEIARHQHLTHSLEIREEPLENLVPALLQDAEESGGFMGLDSPAPSLRRTLRGNPLKRLIRSARSPILTVCGAAVEEARLPREARELNPRPSAA